MATSASEILEILLAAMPDSYQKTVGFPTRDLLAAVALRMASTAVDIEASRLRLDPENLTGSDLDMYIYSRTGIDRRLATFSSGSVHVTGNGTVSHGDLFASDGGVIFMAVETIDVDEEADVPVTCVQSGSAGNLPAHSVTQFPVTLPGISTVDNPAPMVGGYEEEDDATYYERYLLKIRTPPISGNVYHYQSWATEIAGVGNVKVFPCSRGELTVDVVLTGSDGSPADSFLVQQVQDYIDPGSTGKGYGQAPIGARCFVSAATARPVALSVMISRQTADSDAALSDAIQKAVTACFGSVAFQQDYISYAQVAKTILSVPGVMDFERLRLDGGTDNIRFGERECAVLGEVEIRYA